MPEKEDAGVDEGAEVVGHEKAGRRGSREDGKVAAEETDDCLERRVEAPGVVPLPQCDQNPRDGVDGELEGRLDPNVQLLGHEKDVRVWGRR